MFKRLFSASPISADLAALILRTGTSFLMLVYGYQKFKKLLEGDFSFADPIGLGEPVSLVLTVFAEFFCSVFLLLGWFTRPALIFLIFTMLVVVLLVHAGDPFDQKEHGISFLIPYLSLFLTGPGKYSLDYRLSKR